VFNSYTIYISNKISYQKNSWKLTLKTKKKNTHENVHEIGYRVVEYKQDSNNLIYSFLKKKTTYICMVCNIKSWHLLINNVGLTRK